MHNTFSWFPRKKHTLHDTIQMSLLIIPHRLLVSQNKTVCFFCTGVKVVFRVGLVLIRLCLGAPEKLSSCPGMYETLEKIRKLPPDIDESYIVREVCAFTVRGLEISRKQP